MAQNDVCQIGSTVTITGRLSGSQPVVVAGRLDGEIRLTAPLTVEAGATVTADVAATRVIVRGTLTGNVEASESLSLDANARVEGDVRTPRLSIAEGASIRGSIDMSAAAAATTSES